MAYTQYNGYLYVPHSTFAEWEAATYHNGYNVDGYAGNQCWDYCALLWWQYGLRLITKPGGNGKAIQCWTISRNQNAQPPFIAVEGVQNIKKGDVLVFYPDGTVSSTTGHICFAYENYDTRENASKIKCLGQNQGSKWVNIVNVKLSAFAGIFRNTNWDSTPSPTPSPGGQKKAKFPWPVAWQHWSNFKR